MRAVVLWTLLGVASLLTLVCCVGAAVMSDPLQRLHFIAPPSSLAVVLVAAALFVADSNPDVGAKALLSTFALTWLNGVATHATARAVRTRRHGTWLPVPGERIPIRGRGADARPGAER